MQPLRPIYVAYIQFSSIEILSIAYILLGIRPISIAYIKFSNIRFIITAYIQLLDIRHIPIAYLQLLSGLIYLVQNFLFMINLPAAIITTITNYY